MFVFRNGICFCRKHFLRLERKQKTLAGFPQLLNHESKIRTGVEIRVLRLTSTYSPDAPGDWNICVHEWLNFFGKCRKMFYTWSIWVPYRYIYWLKKLLYNEVTSSILSNNHPSPVGGWTAQWKHLRQIGSFSHGCGVKTLKILETIKKKQPKVPPKHQLQKFCTLLRIDFSLEKTLSLFDPNWLAMFTYFSQVAKQLQRVRPPDDSLP